MPLEKISALYQYLENKNTEFKIRDKNLKEDSQNVNFKNFFPEKNLKIFQEKEKFKIDDRVILNVEETEKTPTKLKIHACAYLKYLIATFCQGKFDSQSQQIKEIEEIELKELDISEILKKLHEIEKLKCVIFNEYQLKLFNLIGKPFLQLEPEDTKELIESDLFSKNNKNNVSNIDQRLFQLYKIRKKG